MEMTAADPMRPSHQPAARFDRNRPRIPCASAPSPLAPLQVPPFRDAAVQPDCGIVKSRPTSRFGLAQTSRQRPYISNNLVRVELQHPIGPVARLIQRDLPLVGVVLDRPGEKLGPGEVARPVVELAGSIDRPEPAETLLDVDRHARPPAAIGIIADDDPIDEVVIRQHARFDPCGVGCKDVGIAPYDRAPIVPSAWPVAVQRNDIKRGGWDNGS